MTETIQNIEVPDIKNFDVNDIKNYKSTDSEYYKLYMRKRYKDIISRSVICDICNCSVRYSSIARHKRTQKCINHNITVVDKFIDKATIKERVDKLEKLVESLTLTA